MISVDWTLGLQFINFAVLLFVLNKILYKPLKKVIAERRETVETSYNKAKDLQAGIDDKMQRYQQQLHEAKAAANEERNALKKHAAKEEANILSEAHQKSNKRLQSIKSQVEREADDASSTLKAEVETLAEQIATKILGRNIA